MRRRVYAFTTDLFLIILINKLLITAYTNVLGMTIFHFPFHIQKSIIVSLTTFFTLSLLSTFMLYFFISYRFSSGQTPGKAFFNICVVGKKEKLTTWECAGRTLGYFICYALGLFLYLIPFLRKDKKGLPDFISRTQVKMAKAEAIIVEEQPDLFDRAA